MSFRVIVAGGQDFNDYELMKAKLNKLFTQKKDITIVSAKAKGADTLGEKYAKFYKLKIDAVAPDWKRYGQMAWRIRNVEMAEQADALVAFYNGHSKGTKHMINCAIEKDLAVRIIYY